MIHVDREKISPPAVLGSDFVNKSLADADAFYSLSIRDRRQRRLGLSLTQIHKPVEAALRRLFHDKCAYCEGMVNHPVEACINQYRPRRNTLGQDGETYLDHYWWLAFQWENLFLCCPECNRMKGNRFPIEGPRAEILANPESLKAELPLLLNPCEDRPEEHLSFEQDGRVVALSQRGEISIQVLGLNRASLVEQRAQVAKSLMMELKSDFKPAVETLRKWLTKTLGPELPFLGLRRKLVRKWLETWLGSDAANKLSQVLVEFFVVPVWLPVLQYPLSVLPRMELPAPSVESSGWQEKRAYYSQLRTIERVEMENFKGISHLKIETPRSSSASESWVTFLGENGTGKSSVLQGIALALLGQRACNALRLDGRNFVRRGTRAGSVRVWLTNTPTPVTLTFNVNRRAFHITPPEPAVLLLGFGATRLLPRSRHTQKPSRRSNRVKNLFDPFARLNHAERWLIDRSAVSDDRFNRIAIALKKLLMLTDAHQFSRDKDRVWVKLHGPKVTLSELSDGYQSIVVMAINIIMGVVDRWKEIDLAEGVVLIDELEAHLHPIWKMEIVGLLRQVFPKMVFFGYDARSTLPAGTTAR